MSINPTIISPLYHLIPPIAVKIKGMFRLSAADSLIPPSIAMVSYSGTMAREKRLCDYFFKFNSQVL